MEGGKKRVPQAAPASSCSSSLRAHPWLSPPSVPQTCRPTRAPTSPTCPAKRRDAGRAHSSTRHARSQAYAPRPSLAWRTASRSQPSRSSRCSSCLNPCNPRNPAPPVHCGPHALQPQPKKRVPQAAPASSCSSSLRAHPSSMSTEQHKSGHRRSRSQPHRFIFYSTRFFEQLTEVNPIQIRDDQIVRPKHPRGKVIEHNSTMHQRVVNYGRIETECSLFRLLVFPLNFGRDGRVDGADEHRFATIASNS